MKKMKVVCKNCGHEETVEIMNDEEAKKKNVRLVRPRCSRCGSSNVSIHG